MAKLALRSDTVVRVPSIPATLPEDRSACTPCRGTGKVISGLGGTPHELDCPWCGGSGRYTPPVAVESAESAAAST